MRISKSGLILPSSTQTIRPSKVNTEVVTMWKVQNAQQAKGLSIAFALLAFILVSIWVGLFLPMPINAIAGILGGIYIYYWMKHQASTNPNQRW
jgi:hypothetical protein